MGLRILDDKGRIFGKISIIDLLTILAVVSVAVWFGYSMFGKNLHRDVAERQEESEIVVVVSAIRPSTVEAIAKSRRIFEFKTGAYMGEIVGVETEPSSFWLIEGDGKWVQTGTDDRLDAFVTIKGTVRVGEDVITMNGVEIRVGGSLSLKTKFAAFQGHVMLMDLDLGGPSQ